MLLISTSVSISLIEIDTLIKITPEPRQHTLVLVYGQNEQLEKRDKVGQSGDLECQT